jgi:serine/threonine-protein kinase
MPQDVAVSDLLLEWEERAAAGRPISPEQLCSTRPELLGELRRRIALLRFVSPLLDLGGQAGDGVPTVPGFQVLNLLGGGGMGVVYRARDVTLDRVVAIKMPQPGALAGEVARSRFEREARVLAQLRHPNIVPVHAAGLADGRPYFVMDYLPQGSLAGQSSRLAGRVEAVTEVIEKVARAVQHAHEQGILHRDLKPANILLDEHGQPLVADFGVAALLDPDAEEGDATTVEVGAADDAGPTRRLTRTGATLGTPAYMAPELFGAARLASPAADVWALGVILYELLTGRRPFAGGDGNRLEDVIRRADPAPPSAVRPPPRRDRRLDAIVFRCLAKNPGDRYASAGALADDLARWRGQVRAGKRRRRVAAVVVALAAILAVAVPLYRYATNPERAAERIEAALARHASVTLIGETGEPKWSRLRNGAAVRSLARDGTFSVQTWDMCLLELARDPAVSRYRIRAEVRHEQSSQKTPGEVGLFFLLREQETPEGPVNSFGQLTFNDIVASADLAALAPPDLPVALVVPQENVVRLCPHLCPPGSHLVANDHRVGGRSPRLFKPAGHQGGDWRALTVEITPHGVRGEWGAGKAVGEISAKEWGDKVGRALAAPGAATPPADAPPDFSPSGAFGLYVEKGSASFRRVVVEPLGEED